MVALWCCSMKYKHKDHYHQKAKQDGFAARSAYKLQEIQKRFKLIKKGRTVLDLGCAPGAWAQVAANLVGDNGTYYGIDLEAVQIEVPNCEFHQMDANDLAESKLGAIKFDVILSDMAPKTSGVKVQDQARSLALVELVIHTARAQLVEGGNLAFKVFESNELKMLFNKLKKEFERVDRFRPQSTRKGSEEIYFVALGFKGKN